MIVYVNFEVSDFDRSAKFYDALLGELGAKRYVERDNRLIAWGKDYQSSALSISPKTDKSLSDPAHGAVVAFEAGSKEEVDRVFAKGIELGATEYLPITLNERGSYSGCINDFDGHTIRIMCITA